jgi:epoxyqueuosine reductase
MSNDSEDLRSLSLRIKAYAQQLGFELVGISPVQMPEHEESFAEWLRKGFSGGLDYMKRTESLRRDPRQLVPWAESVISVGMNYFVPLPRPTPPPPGSGWISRYAWGNDYHDIVKGRLDELLSTITQIADRPVQGRSFVDSGPVLERSFAGVAGIGWIGKNTQLISPKKGSWFFLGELFVDISLSYDRPIRDRCGRCELCLEACPTGAFVGPFVLDARRCISYLTIELKGSIPRHLRPLIGNHIFGCDICQEICPYNVKAPSTTEARYAPQDGLYAPDLISLLTMSQEDFRRRFRNSPIARAKRRGFLRNVAVALGNNPSPEAVPALVAALADPEPLVRGHVAWALGRIGTYAAIEALRQRLTTEEDAEVTSEIKEALSECDDHAA